MTKSTLIIIINLTTEWY